MAASNKKLLLFLVRSEFRPHRELLAGDLKRPTLDIAVQEDFIVKGGSTLEQLDAYIRACDGIVHVIGKATGAVPEEPAVVALLAKYPDFATRLTPLAEALAKPQPGFSYTQWEAYLAIYHQRPLFIYRPADFDLAFHDAPRAPNYRARLFFHESSTRRSIRGTRISTARRADRRTTSPPLAR